MSYLVCKECGKSYELPEGKSSFNYQRCSCGGRLSYAASLKESNKVRNSKKQNQTKKQRQKAKGIKWFAVFIGFGFLIISLILTVLVLFGTNIPQNAADIPTTLLTEFTVAAILLTIISGIIVAYICGSRDYKDVIINSSLVGVILGVLLGIFGGITIFMGSAIIFGSFSLIGGVLGTLLRRILYRKSIK
jgi:cation transport ATPase